MWNDETDDGLLILQVLLNLIDCIKTLGFAFYILGLILIIVVLLADEQFLLEALLGLLAASCRALSVLNLATSARRLALATRGSTCLIAGFFVSLFWKMLTHFFEC